LLAVVVAPADETKKETKKAATQGNQVVLTRTLLIKDGVAIEVVTVLGHLLTLNEGKALVTFFGVLVLFY